jgi:hypothetical protein
VFKEYLELWTLVRMIQTFLSKNRILFYSVAVLLAVSLLNFQTAFGQDIESLLKNLGSPDLEIRKETLSSKILKKCYLNEDDDINGCQLSKVDFGRITDVLLKLLNDQDASIRKQAVFYLKHSTDIRIISGFARLLEDPDDDVRAVAAEGFEHTVIHDTKIISKLENLLTDKSRGVREGAAVSLGLSGNQRSLLVLQKAREREHDPETLVLFSELIDELKGRLKSSTNKR